MNNVCDPNVIDINSIVINPDGTISINDTCGTTISSSNITFGNTGTTSTTLNNPSYSWPYTTTTSPSIGGNPWTYTPPSTGTFMPLDANKIVEVKDIFLLQKKSKVWDMYPVISITYDSYSVITYCTILKQNSFFTVSMIDLNSAEKNVIATKEQVNQAIRKGININPYFPPDLLTEDEETVKGIVK